jgi:hypothetical protein
MHNAILKFVMTADVIGVHVRGHRRNRLLQQVCGGRLEAADAHAGIDQQIAIPALHVPDIAAEECSDVRFPQQVDFIADSSSLEPTVGNSHAAARFMSKE